MAAISPKQTDVQAALRAFLLAVLPSGVEVIAAQQNRTAEPRSGDFVVMTPIRFRRIDTNIDTSADVRIVASISGAVMTVSHVTIGTIAIGATIFGAGVFAGTKVTRILTGGGGPGTYQVSPPQNVASEVMSAGAKTFQQNAEVTVQLDFHSAATSDAGDMAQTVSTLFRDIYAVDFFGDLPSPQNNVVPFYADDPRQMPFINENQQYEWRWILEAVMQVNQTVSISEPYADAAVVDLISVDAAYPP